MLRIFTVTSSIRGPEYVWAWYEISMSPELGDDKNYHHEEIKWDFPKSISCSSCCKKVPTDVILETSFYCLLNDTIYDCRFCRKTRVDPIPLTDIL